MKKTVLLTSMIAFCTLLYGATITISGKVLLYDNTEHTDISVQIVNLIESIDTTVTTDPTGFYSYTMNVEQLPIIGTTRVLEMVFSKSGYDTKNISRTVIQSTQLEDIYLLPTGSNIDIHELCFITKDSQSGNNLVLWEPQSGFDIVRYIIQKRTGMEGIFDSIGEQYFNSAGIFEDLNSFHTEAEFYRIIPVYGNGNKGIPSQPVRSIVLNAIRYQNRLGGATMQLQMDAFSGIDYTTYNRMGVAEVICERGLTEETLETLIEYSSIQFGSYLPITDSIESNINYLYRIKMVFDHACDPLGIGQAPGVRLKSDSGPFSQSLSNLAESGVATAIINSMIPKKIEISPTVAKETINFECSEKGIYKITSANGTFIATGLATKGYNSLDISELNTGNYILSVQGTEEYSAGQFIVE